ncbi:MAG TPA: hypothetical protein VFY43_05730 [Candidatus Limnocylindria bacterium]|nr:hypothetical protein [Candidatus Limnocylindria bacterium]
MVGAAGAPLILGQSNGASGKTTTLTSNQDGGAVMKIVNSGDHRALYLQASGKTPLKLKGPANKAPMTVNSSTTVTNLSADLVDGWSANSLIRLAYATDDFVVNGDTSSVGTLSTTITAPARGWITISANAYVTSESAADDARCAIEVNNSEVLGSRRWVDLNSAAGIDEVNCSTSAGFRVCSAGTYTIDAEFSSIGVDLNVNDASLTAQYSPFSGSGSQPPLLVCLPF